MIKLLLEYKNSDLPRDRKMYVKCVKSLIKEVSRITISDKAKETAEALSKAISDYQIYPKLKCVTLSQQEIF